MVIQPQNNNKINTIGENIGDTEIIVRKFYHEKANTNLRHFTFKGTMKLKGPGIAY